MNCQDFEGLWNERLDLRGAVAPEVEHALEAHAAGCPTCRTKGARFLVLSQAIVSLTPLRAPENFTERCETALQGTRVAPRPASTAWLRELAFPLAAAACLVIAALVAFRARGPVGAPAVVDTPSVDAASLPDALADATSATWQLALEASAPAARIGRDVLDTTVDREAPRASLVAPSVGRTASGMLQSVGDRVNEGVQPLSGSAKHAFGFLLGPALDDESVAPRPS